MPDFVGIGLVGWIIIGFLAGSISGLLVRNRTAGGCVANIVVGVLGGLVGGFLGKQLFGNNDVYGWIGAFVVALIGAIVVRLVLGLVTGRRG
jgi:uncharacterized membrane protein YeaQ/YmgE (transglycosylase-associated protein family)